MANLVKLNCTVNCDCGHTQVFDIDPYDIDVSRYDCETCGFHETTTIWIADNCSFCNKYIDAVSISDL